MQNNYYCKKKVINILETPKRNSNISSQLIYGEKYKILKYGKKYLKIKTSYDRYTGYIKPIKKYSKFIATHKIIKLKSNIYLGYKKKIKKKSKNYLPFASKLEILKRDNNFVMFEKNKWLKATDIVPVKKKVSNYKEIFKLFLNCPYKWGGKTYKGIDCSALIQIFYKFNNRFFPRDTIDQIKIKKKLKEKKIFNKGDIVFWKGHVAVCIDSNNLIHAYGPEKKVIIMPILKTIKRIEKTANLKVKKIFKI